MIINIPPSPLQKGGDAEVVLLKTFWTASSIKWEKGYCCRKCGHKKYQVRKDFSRTCNICGDTESPTAGTLFHRLKFGLRKAFFICFEMTTTTKGLSASQVARRYEISRQTAHYFMQKVREAMKSSESHKMNDSV